MKQLLAISGLVLAVFLAAISETSAQTIYSCYNTKSGAMRYVTGPDKCKKTETHISWNTTGTGPQGPAGPQGQVGLQGPPGVAKGATQIAHGLVKNDGSLISGSGISRIVYHYDGVGSYQIHFDPVFEMSSVPTCMAIAHNIDAQAFVFGWADDLSWVTVYTIIHGMHPPIYIDDDFSFFCVQ